MDRLHVQIIQMMHTLKYYYWLVDPRAKSGFAPRGLDGPRPDNGDIVTIRTAILQFVRRLVLKPLDGDTFAKDDELQALFNFMATVHEVGIHFWIYSFTW